MKRKVVFIRNSDICVIVSNGITKQIGLESIVGLTDMEVVKLELSRRGYCGDIEQVSATEYCY